MKYRITQRIEGHYVVETRYWWCPMWHGWAGKLLAIKKVEWTWTEGEGLE